MDDNAEKIYTQAQMDDITSKVRDNAVKNFLKDKFGCEDLEGFVKSYQDVQNENRKLKLNDLKNVFVNSYGGLENAFDTLISSNPNITKDQLKDIKVKQPFLFNKDDTTIINISQNKPKNYSNDNLEYFDGSNFKLK